MSGRVATSEGAGTRRGAARARPGVRAERRHVRQAEVVALAHVVAELATHREIRPTIRPIAEYQGLYPEMLAAPIEKLVDLGHQRYIRRGNELRELALVPRGRSRSSA